MKLKQLLSSAYLGFFMVTTTLYAAPIINLPDFTPIVEKAGKAVVNISTAATVRHQPNMMNDPFFELFRQFGLQVPRPGLPREYREQSLGSGFIIAEDGYILTNAHVVVQADQITVKLADKRIFKARVIGLDARTDVALLKIEAKNLPKVDIGDPKTAKVGEWVLAIGSPFGLESTVTSGILSAKGRSLPNENYVPFLQTDAAVNPGNSGGPLFNLYGQVIGINSQIYSPSGAYMGVSFAIPIDEAMRVVQALKANGRVIYGRIGVTIQSLNEELAKSFGLTKVAGALVSAVERDGPAAQSGIKAGDIVVRVNNIAISEPDDLSRLIASIKPGTNVTLQLWRDRAWHTAHVTVAELKVDARTIGREQQKSYPNDPDIRFGLQLAEIPQKQLNRLGIQYGLYVQMVSGAALEAGLRQGDIIVGIGSKNIHSFYELRLALRLGKVGHMLPIHILRQGDALFLSLKIPQ